jgi:hypothetical protein
VAKRFSLSTGGGSLPVVLRVRWIMGGGKEVECGGTGGRRVYT